MGIDMETGAIIIIAGIAIAAFALGVAAGYAVALRTSVKSRETAREIAEDLLHETESLRRDERDVILNRIKESFGELSLEALGKSTEQFMTLAKERLDSQRELHTKELDTKKGLIDQQLERMKTELDNVAKVIGEYEKDRANKFGEISHRLEETGKQTSELIRSTNTLREALAGSKSRGQWGERMAEDVLRLAGFVENVNYVKQKSMEGSRDIPDFTFFLPRSLKLNMDVKFPYDNYVRFLESESDTDRENYRKGFLRDVRNRIQEVAGRGYISPENNTVDFVLLFIPNEQIYSFINEQDSDVVDDGIRKHVIVCSPITLFSVLAIIRAAVDNFALEQKSNQMLSLFGAVFKQWKLYVASFEKLGRSLDTVKKDYETLVGTRQNQLEKPLKKIDELRSQNGIEAAESIDVSLLGDGGERDMSDGDVEEIS